MWTMPLLSRVILYLSLAILPAFLDVIVWGIFSLFGFVEEKVDEWRYLISLGYFYGLGILCIEVWLRYSRDSWDKKMSKMHLRDAHARLKGEVVLPERDEMLRSLLWISDKTILQERLYPFLVERLANQQMRPQHIANVIGNVLQDLPLEILTDRQLERILVALVHYIDAIKKILEQLRNPEAGWTWKLAADPEGPYLNEDEYA